MRKERAELYDRLETAFLDAERAADDAAQRAASLLTAMHEAQRFYRMDRRAGRREFAAVSAAVARLAEVRDCFTDAHEAAIETRCAMIPERSFGDVGACNPKADIAPLRIVA